MGEHARIIYVLNLKYLGVSSLDGDGDDKDDGGKKGFGLDFA